MLKSKNLKTDKELMLIREKNMEQWTEEDHQFYGEFLDNFPIANELSLHKSDDTLDQSQAAFDKEAWQDFQQIVRQTKNRLMGRTS